MKRKQLARCEANQESRIIHRAHRRAGTKRQASLLLLCVLQLHLCVVAISSMKIEHEQQAIPAPPTKNAVHLHPFQSRTATSKPLQSLNQIYPHLDQQQQHHSSPFTEQQLQHSQQRLQRFRQKQEHEKICIGTSSKLSRDHNLKLSERYTNCTHVIGNLEIAFIDSQAELSALESIREITGYLLIHRVATDRISMPNLQIIRGKDLFRYEQDDQDYAMILIENDLKSLELPDFREILQGNLGAVNNKNLCTLKTIAWSEFLNKGYRAIFAYVGETPQCQVCDSACHGAPGCWTEAPDMCQRTAKSICASECSNRCFGPLSSECCHEFCAGGCFGPNKTDCVACKNFDNDGACVPECPPLQVYNPGQYKHDANPLGKYAFGATCVKECPKDLLRDNGACVRVCPVDKVSLGGECISCGGAGKIPCDPPDPSLAMATKASGPTQGQLAAVSSSAPASTIGGETTPSSGPDAPEGAPTEPQASGRQNSDPFPGCKTIVNSTDQLSGLDSAGPPPQCIKLNGTCPDGFYQEYLDPAGRTVCRRCHHRCRRCFGMGTHVTVCECAKYVAGEQCEDYCPRDFFPNEESRRCLRCSPECNGCSGPTEADCHTCRVYRVYQSVASPAMEAGSLENSIMDQPAPDSNAMSSRLSIVGQSRPFNCTSQCPPDKPYRISDSNFPDLYCSELPDVNPDAAPLRTAQTLGPWTSIPLLLIIFAAIGSCFWVHRLESEKDKTVKLTLHLSGIDDVEPLNPSNLKPNLAPLRSIKETELRKGNELGSGFGGTVYQGLWYPEGREHKNPRPVAIKVLRDNGQSNMNKKFLDEAYIMASVNHPNLVQLLAVCMTPKHLMLVTPLMPLGCLLEHVKQHKHEISSKNLLEWSKQVAKGMAYLEENRMVHRDLALRNVLLKTCGRAMISDFGLAKFLEIDQSEYHSLGGRLPIKWLAPECIRERRFTHKSDVWAFGVTVWELFTFGARPFEEYNMKDMLTAIENGARLEQPPYLTTEVYSVMLSCWFYTPEARPSFRQLTQDFVKFSQDPLRYVAIGARGIDYNPNAALDSPTAKFSRLSTFSSPSKQQQQQRHSAHDLDSDLEEYTDSDPEQSQASCSPEPEQPQLIATSELTPSTHNRINETLRFGFDFRRHHQHQNAQSSISESSDIQKTPTTPLKRMHFAADQQLIEEVDYDDVDVFKAANKQQQLDGNNNFITVPPADNTWQRLTSGSLSQSHKSTEQPTDMYDYLLPSPCTEDARNFSQLYGTTGVFDEVDGVGVSEQQKANTIRRDNVRSTSISGAYQVSSLEFGQENGEAGFKLRGANAARLAAAHRHNQNLSASMLGVDNYEYFDRYVSNHYTDMDPSSAAAVVAAAQRLRRSRQHLSTSDEDIPHSLV